MLEGEGGEVEGHSGREERLYDPEEEEEEEGEEEGEEEEEEEELDLEYDYDEDEDDGTDYLHVDMPWGWRKFSSVSQFSKVLSFDVRLQQQHFSHLSAPHCR